MAERVRIILKSGKDQAVKRFHPWIFSGAIKKIYGTAAEGDIVDVFDNKNTFLARGHYQPGSIAVRILSFEDTETGIDFFRERIRKAIDYRKSTVLKNINETNVFRLVHAEGDNLPGLVVDYYNGVVVMQMHSVGMYRLREEFTEILKELLGEKVSAVYDKSGETIPHMSAIVAENGFLYGSSDRVQVSENGFRFIVDIESGQKTGFFIDQRENRKMLAEYSEGRTVLNMFSYTGGFSVYAMKNARLVCSVD
ncbi:MAG: class I SAM-dependent rRNA methyltransferase, partial [Bacteroidales bacterium]|nr:class I SAM-dependent rRNA methyltransferase [Bacteroidales bacterium]